MTISWDDQSKRPLRARSVYTPLLCCALLLCGVSATPGMASAKAKTTTIVGDVTGDGAVTPADALAIMTALADSSLPSGFTIGHGDANGDGVISSVDAQIILAYAVGLDVSEFPVGKPAAGGAQ